MKNHSIKLLLLSSVAGLAANTAIAQETETTAPENAQVLDTIVVKGIRASLQRSQAVKQNATSVVEAISAEDIGKLPDSSIAESLARLPGLAGERRAGRTSGISVRGFREDFVGVTLNGRELIGIGDNRGVEFDLYPSEILDGAVIYKAPNADLTAMGVGGTIDLKTANPLSRDRTLAFTGSLEQNQLESPNPDFDDKGHRFAINYSDKFLDDTLGVAVAVASTESPSQTEFFSVWGYTQNDFDAGTDAEGLFAPDGFDISSRSRVLERDTISAILEFEPTDKFRAKVDYLFVDFADQGISRGFIQDLPNLSDGSGVISSSGNAITAARSAGFHSVIRSDPLNRQGELTNYGLNLEYDFTDSLSVEFDYARSESSKSDQRGESYAGVGRSGLNTTADNATIREWAQSDTGLRFTNSSIDFSDYNLVKLAGPQAWGGSLASVSELEALSAGVDGVGFVNAQDGFVNTGFFDEELDSARFEATKEVEGNFFTSFSAGVRYSNRTKSKTNEGFFLTAETFPLDGAIPEQYREGITDLTWVGLGNVVAYDALAVINSDFYTKTSAAELEPTRLGDTYTVDEKVWQPFVMANFDTDANGVRIFGNIGAQGVLTEQTASGFSAFVDTNQRVTAIPITDSAEYERFLPSLNLNFELTDEHVIRLAASKVISRPRIDQLNPGGSVFFSNNVNNVTATTAAEGPWTSTSGNALLRPYEANQIDLSYEYYFSDVGYVSLGAFYKDLVNWNVSSSEQRDFTEFYIPGFHQAVDTDGTIFEPATFQGVNTFVQGGLQGDVNGVEFNASVPFGDFVQPLDGLGLVFSAAWTDGELDNGSRVPGLSEEVYQTTFFYQRGGFEARVSGTKRSDFLSETRGGSNSLTPVSRNEVELVDAQISYDFASTGIEHLDGLRVSLQGQNLTDEDETSIDTASGLVTRNERYGRNILLTFNYSFW